LALHSGREADHSSQSSAEIKEWVELYLHSPNTPSWRGAQLGGAQGQLYLLLLWNPKVHTVLMKSLLDSILSKFTSSKTVLQF
jgi:hypothetical protein